MASIQDLIAAKDYPKALQRLEKELQKNPRDPRLRLRYADVLLLADRQRDGVKELLELADMHASDGFTAKAIALLKRVEKLEPRRADIKSRLKNLVQQKVSQAPSAAPSGGGFEFGMEEFDPSEEIAIGGAPVSVTAHQPVPMPTFEPEPEPAAPEPAPSPEAAPDPEPLPEFELTAAEPEPLEISPDPEPAQPVPLDDDLEGLDFVELDPEPEVAPASEQRSFLNSPLFEGLSEDELMAVIQGLNFESFAAGDIVVAEGAPGTSMYIITTGSVKAFVKDGKGHYRLVKELLEGDFFGEVSVLTGRPRTATVTAAADCELLELDRKTLDAITARYPRVHAVLKKFHEKRAQATVEALLKKG